MDRTDDLVEEFEVAKINLRELLQLESDGFKVAADLQDRKFEFGWQLGADIDVFVTAKIVEAAQRVVHLDKMIRDECVRIHGTCN